MSLPSRIYKNVALWRGKSDAALQSPASYETDDTPSAVCVCVCVCVCVECVVGTVTAQPRQDSNICKI